MNPTHPFPGARTTKINQIILSLKGYQHKTSAKTVHEFLPRETMLSTVFAVVVCLCVCVFVTLWYCIKTAKRRITQTTPHDSPMILVF